MEFHERINYTKYASGETLFEYTCEVEVGGISSRLNVIVMVLFHS